MARLFSIDIGVCSRDTSKDVMLEELDSAGVLRESAKECVDDASEADCRVFKVWISGASNA